MIAKGSGITCGYPVSNIPIVMNLDKVNKCSTAEDLMLFLTLIVSVITLIVTILVLVETYKARSLMEKNNERRD